MMRNMGGPSTIPEVEPFLNRLFLDQDIMQLKEGAAMKALAYVIVKRRLNRIQEQYNEIGGGSPIHKLSDKQGALRVLRGLMIISDILGSKLKRAAPT